MDLEYWQKVNHLRMNFQLQKNDKTLTEMIPKQWQKYGEMYFNKCTKECIYVCSTCLENVEDLANAFITTDATELWLHVKLQHLPKEGELPVLTTTSSSSTTTTATLTPYEEELLFKEFQSIKQDNNDNVNKDLAKQQMPSCEEDLQQNNKENIPTPLKLEPSQQRDPRIQNNCEMNRDDVNEPGIPDERTDLNDLEIFNDMKQHLPPSNNAAYVADNNDNVLEPLAECTVEECGNVDGDLIELSDDEDNISTTPNSPGLRNNYIKNGHTPATALNGGTANQFQYIHRMQMSINHFQSPIISNNNGPYINEPVYKCNYCPKRFHHVSHLDRHQREHLIHYQVQRKTQSRPYQCNLCGKRTITEETMTKHKKRFHSIESDSETIRCNICQKLLLKNNIQQHLLVHTNLRVRCRYCDRSYKQKQTLRMHMKKSHPNIRYDMMIPITTEECVTDSHLSPQLTPEEQEYMYNFYMNLERQRCNNISSDESSSITCSPNFIPEVNADSSSSDTISYGTIYNSI